MDRKPLLQVVIRISSRKRKSDSQQEEERQNDGEYGLSLAEPAREARKEEKAAPGIGDMEVDRFELGGLPDRLRNPLFVAKET